MSGGKKTEKRGARGYTALLTGGEKPRMAPQGAVGQEERETVPPLASGEEVI